MNFGTKKYHLESRVKDGRRFSIDNLERYSLSLQAGYNDFQICVTDSRHDACLLLEDYSLQDAETEDTYIDILQSLFEEHHFLTANFWHSVTFSVKNIKFSLAPAEYFTEDAVFDLLKYNARLSPQQEVYRYAEIRDAEAVAAFAVSKKLSEFLDTIYLNVKCRLVHQSCALLQGMIHQDLLPGHQVFCYVDREYLHLSVMKGKQLIFYNLFPLKGHADLAKYVLAVTKSLHLDIQSIPVRIWGFIDQRSVAFHELTRYARRARVGSSPSFLKFSYDFDEIPEQRYLDVYGIYLCVKK